jgi:hypothetical protein
MLDIVDLIAVRFCRTPTVFLYSHHTADTNEARLVHDRWMHTDILAWHGVHRTDLLCRWTIWW